MELLLLNEKFELLSHPIDRYYSLIWRERYYDEGDFELHLAADYLETVLRSEYLYNNERDEAMVIEGVEAQDDGKRTIKITGRSLESLFRDRVMDAEGSSSGKVEEISRSAVQTYAMTGSRAIPLLKLGVLGGFTETAAASNKRGAELYEWQRELLRPYEMSFRLHYDYEANSLDYTVYRGLDRTQEQTANNWAIFSTSYENLAQFAYSRSKTDYRNYAIVISSDGTKRVEVDKTGGAKRRELYVDTDDGLDTAAMTQLGEQALTEYAMVETVSGEVQNGANMVYGVDFDLGDLCHIEDAHLGISATARLTEMTTVVENGVTRRIPAFGEQYLNLRQYVAREVGASGASAGSSSGGGGVVDLTGIEQAIAANAAAIEAANDEIEAVQAAVFDNAADIAALAERVAVLEAGGSESDLPSGFIKLAYLESNGTQYIDTEYIPNSDTRVYVECVFPILSASTAGLFGVRKTSSSNMFYFDAYQNNYRSNYNTVQGVLEGVDNFGEQIFTIDKNKNVTYINGKAAYTHTYQGFTCPGSMYIFCMNNNGTPYAYVNARIYSMKIYENGVLMRNYIPCINANGEYGLFDKVNYQFYGNAGTGEFTGGAILPDDITQLEYLKATGTQYIKTGVTPTSDTRVVIDFELLTNSIISIFGSRETYRTKSFLLFGHENNSYFQDDFGTTSDTSVISDIAEYHVDKNKNVTTINDSIITHAVQSFVSAYEMFLFAVNNGGSAMTAYMGSMTIKSCLIYQGNMLIRCLIPCRKSDDTYGMYDLINSKFYGNAGTGSFTGG